MLSSIELKGVAMRARFTKARIAMLLNKPFYGALAVRLVPVARAQQAPMSTDGEHLFFNPDLIESWSQDDLETVIVHEVMHCALGHPWRRGDRDHELWNEACDHVVNLRLQEEGHKPVEGWLADPQYAGLSSEVVYSRMPRKAPQPKPDPQQQGQQGQQGQQQGQQPQQPGQPGGKQQGSGPPPAPPRPGDVEDPQPSDDGTESAEQRADRLDAEWRIAVQNAARSADKGSLPGFAAEAVEEARRAKVDWRDELRRCIAEVTRDDYCWQQPSRRFLSRGLYMPSLRDERPGTVVIVRDTSGSISADVLAQFNAEVAAVVGEVKPGRTVVIDCDAAVRKTWDIEPGDSLPADLAQAHGRGGTDFRPPFRWLAQQDIEPKVLIYLTDMEGSFPDEEPDFSVIWCATTREIGPFGQTIPMLG